MECDAALEEYRGEFFRKHFEVKTYLSMNKVHTLIRSSFGNFRVTVA
jgi:hypothetical protein